MKISNHLAWLPRRKSKNRAAAALELALVLPLFLLIIIGILEFGRALMMYQMTTNSAREAARRAIITGADDTEVLSIINSYLDACGIKSAGRTIEIRDSDGNVTSIANIGSHEQVTIAIGIPFNENSFGISSWFVGKTMYTEVSMRRE